MSVYSTQYITRKEAEDMVKAVRMKLDRGVEALSDEELDKELHEYVYSDAHADIVGLHYNYIIGEEQK